MIQYNNKNRAENNRQQVASHDDPILAGQIMNTIFFLPKKYQITLAIDRYYYIEWRSHFWPQVGEKCIQTL